MDLDSRCDLGCTLIPHKNSLHGTCAKISRACIHLTMEGTERSWTLPRSWRIWARLGCAGVAGAFPLTSRDDSGTRDCSTEESLQSNLVNMNSTGPKVHIKRNFTLTVARCMGVLGISKWFILRGISL